MDRAILKPPPRPRTPGRRSRRACLHLLAPALLLLSVLVPSPPLGAQVREFATLAHEPPEEARQGKDLAITVRVVGDSVATGEVFYRPRGGEYSVAPLLRVKDYWVAYLPGEDLRPPAVEYYLRVETRRGRLLTHPRTQPQENPVSVTVIPGETRVIVLTPQPGEILSDSRPDIAVLFDPPLPDTTGLLALLDRRDVTSEAEYSTEFLLLHPPFPLTSGEHEVRIVYLDESGRTGEGSWRFTVLAHAARPSPLITLHGVAEAGIVTAGALSEGETGTLRYPEGSEARVDLYAYGSAGGRDFSLGLNRNPTIEKTVRWIFRLRGNRWRISGGDIAPHFSEETLTGLPVDGLAGELYWRGGRTRLAAVRTLESDLSCAFASYDQYILGFRHELGAGPLRLAAIGAYGFDDEGSLPEPDGPAEPDSLCFGPAPALENLVWGWEAETHRGPLALKGSVNRSTVRGDTMDTAAWSYRVRLERTGGQTVSLEYVSSQRGYYSLGSPSLDVGVEGISLDVRLGSDSRWRTTLHLQLYRDYESFLPLKKKQLLTLLDWRIDFPRSLLAGHLSPFMTVRYHRFPYRTNPERRESLGLGTYLDYRSLTGSLSVRYLRTRSPRTTRDEWSLNGRLGYNQGREGPRARLEGWWYRTRDDLGERDERLPGARAELGYRHGRWEVRATGEWISTEDRILPTRDYEEGLFSLLLGCHF